MATINYYRVSTNDQSIKAQRHQLGAADDEYHDEGISGAILAADRPGFAAMLAYARKDDEIRVAAVDRLGRDSIDIQLTVRALRAKGVHVFVAGLGRIEGEMGELILTLLAQLAQMERNRIKARCDAGRDAARASLSATGRTHRGKTSLGRPMSVDPVAVLQWRADHAASAAVTAKEFGISADTVKRYARQAKGG